MLLTSIFTRNGSRLSVRSETNSLTTADAQSVLLFCMTSKVNITAIPLDHSDNDLLVKLPSLFNQMSLEVTDVTNVCIINLVAVYRLNVPFNTL